MGTPQFWVSITEVKGDKKNSRFRIRLKRLQLTNVLVDNLVYDFEIRKPMNDLHQGKSR